MGWSFWVGLARVWFTICGLPQFGFWIFFFLFLFFLSCLQRAMADGGFGKGVFSSFSFFFFLFFFFEGFLQGGVLLFLLLVTAVLQCIASVLLLIAVCMYFYIYRFALSILFLFYFYPLDLLSDTSRAGFPSAAVIFILVHI